MALEDAGASATLHLHTCYEITCVERGCGRLLSAVGIREIAPTHLVIIPPGDAHAVAGTAGCGGVRRLMWVNGGRLRRGLAEPHALAVFADPGLVERFRVLHDRLLCAPHVSDRSVTAPGLDDELHELTEFLDVLVAAYAEFPVPADEATRPGARVARARTYLHDHWAAPLSLDALARIACCSKYHLISTFRQAYGLPPRAYQTRLRLAHAQESLALGETITGVAYDTGFADQAHLTRAFKQAFGITPGGWARCRPPDDGRATAA